MHWARQICTHGIATLVHCIIASEIRLEDLLVDIHSHALDTYVHMLRWIVQLLRHVSNDSACALLRGRRFRCVPEFKVCAGVKRSTSGDTDKWGVQKHGRVASQVEAGMQVYPPILNLDREL
ncbi:hypothetical protein P153DRAFT_2855 [Dothidotthia symphoricarpi CBS 119687]|uniref:Uncharacterized protein n=1 Tax=Dothidotthia symphoricarpi CBS 119687 TaxID=1392245 RepID=A0A6A6AR82_9PLEO|nr:uncharacterized protein P153DRAFT_2855 [Dothidotthia symphoricarpi CBS 119687]KAF2134492.1 hypothetical protein P153DRAFT_2855 [Dothidotthia symphoricarpi CBS 119687]